MGKGLRSNSKKAVRRWRREIFTERSSWLKKTEAEKQQILQQILACPKIETTTDSDVASQRRAKGEGWRGRLDLGDGHDDEGMDEEEGMEVKERPAVNVTQINAMKRHRRRLRRLRRDPSSHPFIVTECERRQISKQRAREDTTDKIEKTLGLGQDHLPSIQDSSHMEIKYQNPQPQRRQMKRKLPSGSQWLRFHKIARGRRPGKKRVMARYRTTGLKGITQYYPLKKEEMAIDG